MNAEPDAQTRTPASRLPPPILASELAAASRTLSERRAELRRRLGKLEDPAVRRELERVELALAWCRAGVYGRCCVCGAPLPASARESDPADLACERCHAMHEDRPKAREMRTLSFSDGLDALNEAFVHARNVARRPGA